MSVGQENKYLINGAIDRTIVWNTDMGLKIDLIDDSRPWGAFVQFKRESAVRFCDIYFTSKGWKVPIDCERTTPKILILAQDGITSVQYHLKRDEYQMPIEGKVEYHLNCVDMPDDDYLKSSAYKSCENMRMVFIPATWRHSIKGVAHVSRVAEIWYEPDPKNPTDEVTDNYRVYDFYGRKSEGAQT